MKTLVKVGVRMSEVRERLNAIADTEDMTDELREESKTLQAEYADLEVRHRAALVASEDAPEPAAAPPANPDPDRVELRNAASVGRFLMGAAKGSLSGAEAELADECGLIAGQIPLEMWQPPVEQRASEDRAITATPTTVGVNLDTIRPYVFAPAVVDRLMVEMPQVESGTFATATITTAATADAVAKGAEVPETAATFTASTATPKRVGTSLNLAAEDIQAVGTSSFEAVLRQHISLALSAELDDQMLNGDGQNDDLIGIFKRLTDPNDPAAGVATFDTFVSAFVDGIDGLWATETSQIGIVAGVDTYKVAGKAFRDVAATDLGAIAFTDYAAAHYGGFWTNSRMPATASHIQQAILTRRGQSMMPSPTRTAVCPHWGYLAVDDIYTGARKGERRYVLSVLCGHVILVQPNAYKQVAFRVSS